MALGWFKPDLLLADNSDLSSDPSSDPSSDSSDSSELCPLWMENYQEFVLELQTNFGLMTQLVMLNINFAISH